ncbi:MAG: hypothetical protein ACK58L_03465 [Planctomycetota bacterium]
MNLASLIRNLIEWFFGGHAEERYSLLGHGTITNTAETATDGGDE